MYRISVTAEVFQEPMGWLNFSALWNMRLMVVTADVFQEPIGWLNFLAS